MSRVFVTGADGFIGSHLVEELVRRNEEVTAFVYYNSFNSWGWLDHVPPEVRASIRVVPGDIRDAGCVHDAMAGCDVVLHLAALIAIPFSYKAPELYVDTNVKGTLNVLMAARAHGVQRFVQTSTSEVYGTARTVPISETHPLHGQSPYSASKIAADQMATAFHCSFGLPVVIVRPFNTFGPRQSSRAVIPTIIAQIAAGRRRIRLGALHPTRDFTYVADTVDGLIAGATAPDTVVGEVINLGTGHEIAICDLAYLITSMMAPEVEIESDESRLRPRKSEVERLVSDNRKAASLLDWKPSHAGPEGLRRGLENTVRWFNDPANLAAYKSDTYTI